jgi:uncharacterized protein (TIGR03905 family)
MYKYKTSGTCSTEITFDIKDGKVTDINFLGGCNGNLKAISKLVEGMSTDEAIGKLSGIHCGMRPTSCADQLSKAISNAVKVAS